MKARFKYFNNKVVIITGSSKGIGKATALEFLKHGARVVINARNPDMLQSTQDEFKEMGFDVTALAGDVSDYHFCRQMVNTTIDQYGKLDMLINNAGGGFRGYIEDTEPEVFEKVIKSNLMTSIYCTKAALSHIRETRGSIVFISSLAGIRGLPLNAPYCIAKMGLTALAQTLKLEMHGSGVHIALIMVGLTDFGAEKRVVGADGSLISISRKSHHTREQVARIIMKAIYRRKFQVVLTPLGKLNHYMQKISPKLVDLILRKSSSAQAYNQ